MNPHWKHASALVPLAVLSGGWTVLMAVSSAGASPEAATTSLTPPAEAIQAPASVSGKPAGSPAGAPAKRAAPASATTSGGIPAAALAAYQRAAQVMSSTDPSCNLAWPLLAAIGQVESDHGRFGGSVLSPEGVARPAILGVPLNGTRGTARIADTDAGMYDGDASFDRAVGPMQFIPSTWSVAGVDGDGDDQRNPQDIDDAALAAAVYLCSGSDDLATERGVTNAVYRYNHSHDYVTLVKRVADGYAEGSYSTVPTATYATVSFAPFDASPHGSALKLHDKPARKPKPVQTKPAASTPNPPAPKPAPAEEPVKAPAPAKPAKAGLNETVEALQAVVEEIVPGVLGGLLKP